MALLSITALRRAKLSQIVMGSRLLSLSPSHHGAVNALHRRSAVLMKRSQEECICLLNGSRQGRGAARDRRRRGTRGVGTRNRWKEEKGDRRTGGGWRGRGREWFFTCLSDSVIDHCRLSLRVERLGSRYFGQEQEEAAEKQK